jgi:hypothetical protein
VAGPPSALAEPSAGDRQVRAALREIEAIDHTGEALLGMLARSRDEGGDPRTLAPAVRLRTAAGASVRRLRATSPTTGQGRKMRRLGISVALLHREAARMLVAAERAMLGGRTERGVRFLAKAAVLHVVIDARTATARRIVLPDPEAMAGSITVIGGVSLPADAFILTPPPVLAGPGGTMTRCALSDLVVGWRLLTLGIRGTSLVTVVMTSPGGGVDREQSRIVPGLEGVDVILPAVARGNGVYRLTVSQGDRVLADATLTRACR